MGDGVEPGADLGPAEDASMRISHEAIYQALYVQSRGALKRELVACLRTGRALRVPRGRTQGRRQGLVTDQVLISQRPAQATDRAVPGHWEGDLILGLDRSAIGTLVEPTSRFTMLLHLRPAGDRATPKVKNGPPVTGRGAEAVKDAIVQAVGDLPEQPRRSLTWAQGAEMAQHARLRIDTGLQVYFCDPQSPRQRETNENTNRAAQAVLPQGHRPRPPQPRGPRRRRGRTEQQAAKDARLANARRSARRTPRRNRLSHHDHDNRAPRNRHHGGPGKPRAICVPNDSPALLRFVHQYPGVATTG